MEQEINRDDLIYKIGNKTKSEAYDFQKFKTIRSFVKRLKNGIDNFNQYFKPKP